MATLPKFTAQSTEITGITPETQSSSRLSYATNISGNAVGLGAAIYSGVQSIRQNRQEAQLQKAKQEQGIKQENAKIELEMNKLNDNANLSRIEMQRDEAVKNWEAFKAENPNDLDKWQKGAKSILDNYKKNTQDFKFTTPKGVIDSKILHEKFESDFGSNYQLEYTSNKVRINDETILASANSDMKLGLFDKAREKINQTTYTQTKKDEMLKEGQQTYVYRLMDQNIELANYSDLDKLSEHVKANADLMGGIKAGELDVKIEQKRTKLFNDSAVYYNNLVNEYQSGKIPFVDENRLIPSHYESLQKVAASDDGGLTLNDAIGQEIQKDIDKISTNLPTWWLSPTSIKGKDDFDELEKKITNSALSSNTKLVALNKLYGVAAFAASAETNGKSYLQANLKRDLSNDEQKMINGLEQRFASVVRKDGPVSPEQAMMFRKEVYDEVIKLFGDKPKNPEDMKKLLDLLFKQKYDKAIEDKFIKQITRQK